LKPEGAAPGATAILFAESEGALVRLGTSDAPNGARACLRSGLTLIGPEGAFSRNAKPLGLVTLSGRGKARTTMPSADLAVRASSLMLLLFACSFDERKLDEDSGGGAGDTGSGGDSGAGGTSTSGASGTAGSAGAGGSSATAGNAGSNNAGSNNAGSSGSTTGGASGTAGTGGDTAGGGGVPDGDAGTPNQGEGGMAAGANPGMGGEAGTPAVEPCASNLCENGGVCVEVAGSASCDCQGGFGGPRCETRILGVLAQAGCRAEGISGSGTLVVGSCVVGGLSTAITWSGEEGDAAVTLPTLTGGTEAEAFGANANGLVVVGWSRNQAGDRQAVHWAGGAVRGYQPVAGAEDYINRAHRTDADGSVSVGSASLGDYERAVRWDSFTDAPVNVEAGGPHAYSFARGVSADGSFVVGYGTDESGAFTWTAETGFSALPGLDGATDNQALGVSDDGQVVVGQSDGTAARWVNRVPETLGAEGEALGASADGSIIVGQIGNEAFVWTAGAGMRTLTSLLAALGVDLSGFVPNSLTDVSDDGTVMCGYGTLGGAERAFRVTLPDL
jgi:uncharacterized membrane protein